MTDTYITNRDIPQVFDDQVLTELPSRYIPNGYIEGDDMLTISDPRQQRGLEIAATANLTRKGNAWIVPSQSGKGRYTVSPDNESPRCTCPDHETRGVKCKHIFAVEYVISREKNRDGSTTITEIKTVKQIVKRTYPQNWPAYNAAQTHEKERFLDLLRDLCTGLTEPDAPKAGRPRLPIQDA